jgi:hypothetical protein
VAELLDVPVEAVELGPNLAENGGFEKWVGERPDILDIADMATGDPWNKGLFVDTRDSLISWRGTSGKISGLWLQYLQDKEPGRSGFWYWQRRYAIPLTPAAPYLISFYYRTERIPDRAAAVWISYDAKVLFSSYHLPSTRGKWRHFLAIGWNRSGGDAVIRPLLFALASGQVWFDEVKVRQVLLNPPETPKETHFVVR